MDQSVKRDVGTEATDDFQNRRLILGKHDQLVARTDLGGFVYQIIERHAQGLGQVVRHPELRFLGTAEDS